MTVIDPYILSVYRRHHSAEGEREQWARGGTVTIRLPIYRRHHSAEGEREQRHAEGHVDEEGRRDDERHLVLEPGTGDALVRCGGL